MPRPVDDSSDLDNQEESPPRPLPSNPNLNAKKRPASASTGSTSAKKKAKKKKTEKKPKDETRLTVVDPLQRTWVYIVFVHLTGKIIYAGQSIDTTRRWKQHAAKQDSGIQSYLKRKNLTFDKLRIKIVEELPDGCARRDANRMEAFFIAKHNLVYNPIHNAEVANNTNGNYTRDVDVEATTAELEKGYKWPKEYEAAVKVRMNDSSELKAATATIEALKTLQWLNPELEDELQTAIVATEAVKEKLETGPYEYAVETYETYQAMPAYAGVPRNDVIAALNAIKALNNTDTFISSQCKKVWLRLLHTDKNAESIDAMEAMHVMGVVVAWLGRHAEEQLDLTTYTAQRCLKLRDWSEAHDGGKPSLHAKKTTKAATGGLASAQAANEEASLGHWINNWKSKFGKPHASTVRVLLRHFPKLLESLFGRSKDEKTEEMTQTANAMLKAGYAVPMEREALPDKQLKLWPCDAKNKPSYNYIQKILQGGNVSKIDVLLNGVDADRAMWIRAQHTANTPLAQERIRQGNQAAAERGQALKARLQAAA